MLGYLAIKRGVYPHDTPIVGVLPPAEFYCQTTQQAVNAAELLNTLIDRVETLRDAIEDAADTLEATPTPCGTTKRLAVDLRRALEVS